MSFYKLGINHFYNQILEENFITAPTPIQEMVIPEALKGHDVIGEAQTGTGKTLAFILPSLQRVDFENKHVSILVIAPTRELAIQITDVAKLFYDVNVLNVYGGQDFTAQMHALERRVDIVIATPGRLRHHLREGRLDLSQLETLIIDEADHLFKKGFLSDVEAIANTLPEDRQTLLFSATLDDSVTAFSKKYMKDPKTLKAPKEKVTLDAIEQLIIASSSRKKFHDLLRIFKKDEPSKCIIFCRSKLGVDNLQQKLVEAEVAAEKLHGGLNQTVREDVMRRFRNGDFQYLVATDVAARGLDITGVSHVINYNLPDQAEDYVHRIGRTGRAGFSGIAYTLLTGKDTDRLSKIEAYIGMAIPRRDDKEPR